MRKLTAALLGAAVLAIPALAGCDSGPTAQGAESKAQQSNFDRLQAQQPGRGMQYSPTREAINYFADTWGKPDKLSYVYLLNSAGNVIGYYVMKGLPVSYCASLYSPVKPVDAYNTTVLLPQPSVDGVYYSGSQCQQYFGRDAKTNTYMEFTAGNGLNFLVYEQPLGRPETDSHPLGPTVIGQERP